MVEASPVTTLMPTPLEARPPTPPRESRSEPKGFFGRLFTRDSASRRSSAALQITPNSSAEAPVETSTSIRKKVGFSESTEFVEHPVQHLPPSAQRRPSKSILKVHNGFFDHDSIGVESNDKLRPPHHYSSWAAMLESVVQQLAGKDRSSKMDAYLMLSASLKAAENVPDPKALKDKLGLLCQFIGQDLMQKLDNGKQDSPLVVSALVLLSSLLYKPAIADRFPAEFPLQIVEYAIRCFEEGSMSKEVVKHMMFALAQQKFSPKVLTQERVGRLIMALHNIENHTTGKSVVVGRLNIYRALIRRSRAHMIANTVWIEDLFTDMLSSLKEIRHEAVTMGLEFSLSLGTESAVSRAVANHFKLAVDEKIMFADFYAAKLKAMAKNKAESAVVPQIWSVIILFLRSNPKFLEQWVSLSSFLSVLQLCFNSSDTSTKVEANYAWNRFIFALQLSEKTAPKTRTLLCNALLGQFRQRQTISGRKSTLSSICHLLYYALRPTVGSTQLDMYWDEFIVPLVEKLLNVRDSAEASKSDAGEACLILGCLFDTTTPRKWSDTRAMENFHQSYMSAQELPTLDSRWLRRNSSRVFSVLVPLIERLYWDLAEDSAITKLWQAYISSIASPAVMEVKVSIDTMSCIASLYSPLYKIWSGGPESLLWPQGIPSENKTPGFLASFESILLTTIQGLGVHAFSEKLLSISQDTFVAIATPSHQPRKIRGSIKSPLHHLMLLLTTLCPGLRYDAQFSRMVQRILSLFLDFRPSGKSRLEFIKDLIPLLVLDGSDPSKLVWQTLASFATSATDTRDICESSDNIDEPLGTYYRGIAGILEAGFMISPQQPLHGWSTLFEALVTSATIDAGDAGRAIAVIEPLAKSLAPQTLKVEYTSSEYFRLLLAKATYPKDKQALDMARRRMWGAGKAGPTIAMFDPYSQLYEFIQSSLHTAYSSFSKHHLHAYCDLITVIGELLSRCPGLLVSGMLAKIQKGLASWIIDVDRRLCGGTALSQAIVLLWSNICVQIHKMQNVLRSEQGLRDLETLLCSGLQSKHKTIVNISVQLWNSALGNGVNDITYPELLKAALLSLRPNINVKLPFLPNTLEIDSVVSEHHPLDLADSQDDTTSFSGFSTLDSAFRAYREPPFSPMNIRRLKQSTPQVIISSASRKRSREVTPDSNNGRKAKRRDVTPHLRHDNSQIQFEAIESSPTDQIIDSQLLTKKQKEVRERQQADSAMFPSLRYSPAANRSVHTQMDPEPKLPLHSSTSFPKLRAIASSAFERETTPSLVIPSEDDFVASSPTPTRSLRGRPEISEPPSSPPKAIAKKPTVERLSSPRECTPEPERTNNALNTCSFYELTKNSGLQEETELSPRKPLESQPATTSLGFAGFNLLASDNNNLLPPIENTPERPPGASLQAGSKDPGKFNAEQMTADLVTAYQFGSALSHSEAPLLDDEEQALGLENDAGEVLVTPVYDSRPTSSPMRTRSGTAIAPQTPNSPQLLDARSDPASSGKMTDAEDVFEDAISSPRLKPSVVQSAELSSPFSDFDESSALRLMGEYDNGSSGYENLLLSPTPEPVRCDMPKTISAAKDILHMISSSSAMGPRSLRKSILQKTTSMVQTMLHRESSTNKIGLSPTSSFVPETSAPESVTAQRTLDAEGEELDPDSTIVVDASALKALQDELDKLTARSGGRMGIAKKRKLQGITPIDEVPDSQEDRARRDTTSSPKKRPPLKRRCKGHRPATRRASQLEEFQGSEQNVRPSQSQATDYDALIPDTQNDAATVQGPTMSGHGPSTNIEQNSSAVGAKKGAAPAENTLATEADLKAFKQDENTDMGLDTAEEVKAAVSINFSDQTTVDDTNASERTIPALLGVEESPYRADIEKAEAEINGTGAIDLTEPGSSSHPDVVSEDDLALGPTSAVGRDEEFLESDAASLVIKASEEGDVQISPEPAPTPPLMSMFQSLKSQLQSLVGNLGIASLNRREVHDLEDMFMDAKRQLYDAEQRGRGLADEAL